MINYNILCVNLGCVSCGDVVCISLKYFYDRFLCIENIIIFNLCQLGNVYKIVLLIKTEENE